MQVPGFTKPAHWNDDPSAPRAGVVSDAGRADGTDLSDSQIFSRCLATVAHFFVAHLGTLIEAAQSRFFNGGDVYEDILAAVVGLNESISLRRVKPLHSTCCHGQSPIEPMVTA